MISSVLFLGVVVALGSATRERYGLEFRKPGAFIDAVYSTLCEESAVKLELFVNRTVGVVMFAENRARNATVLVYLKQPGVYMNITYGLKKYEVSYTLDFFDNEWNGWHEIEIRVGETRFGFVFDGVTREGVMEEGLLFPERYIEENKIVFGLNLKEKRGAIPGFQGFMRNFQYKSCGCVHWRPIKFVKNEGISFDRLGECGSPLACPVKCSCLLFNSGGKRCDCSGLQCPAADNEVFYKFDNEDLGSYKKQLTVVSKSERLTYGLGIFGQSLKMDEDHFLVLSAERSKSCFKNTFFCESDIYYQFWMKSYPLNGKDAEAELLKHGMSRDSTFGLGIARVQNVFQFIYTTNDNKQYKIDAVIPLLKWIRITLSFNQTFFQLFIDSKLYKITGKYNELVDVIPSIINTKFLFIGKRGSKGKIEIDNFYFSTNESVVKSPTVDELHIEQYKNGRRSNEDCEPQLKGQMVNINNCYLNVFQSSNFSLGFFVSLIFSTEHLQGSVILFDSSFFRIYLMSNERIELRLYNDMSYSIILRKTINNLCHLEISVTPENTLFVYQDVDFELTSFPFRVSLFEEVGHNIYVLMNGDSDTLKELKLLNVNKDIGIRALRIPTSRITSNSEDFDNFDASSYGLIERSDGYLGRGIQLKYPVTKISHNIFQTSCIRNIKLCYNGITLSFWMKLNSRPSIPRNRFFSIFSSGKTGVNLLLNSENDFIVVIENQKTKRFPVAEFDAMINKWCLIELSLSSNGMVFLFKEGIELQAFEELYNAKIDEECAKICFGEDNTDFDKISIYIDEILLLDVGRLFLYANGFLSKKSSQHQLFSFTNNQFGKEITLEGSAKLITTKYGQGVSLNGFGIRFAKVKMKNVPKCFSSISDCRRGILMRLVIRIDSLAINHQVFVSSPQISIGSNERRLFVRLVSSNKSWFFISKDILQVFLWQIIVISWRLDNGLKVFFNGQFIGHVRNGNDFEHTNPFWDSHLYFGRDYVLNSSGYATAVIDDMEFFDADKTHLGLEKFHFENVSCLIRYTFDENKDSQSKVQLGVIGNAGRFNDQLTTNRTMNVPKCFDEHFTGCKRCLTLRFWIYLNKINVTILHARHVKLSIERSGFLIDIINGPEMSSETYLCGYDYQELIKNWNLFELSLDIDEGLLIFVNRELLFCNLVKTDNALSIVTKGIEISTSFDGFLDEMEMFLSRLSILYWNKIVDEGKIENLLQRLKENKKLLKEMTNLASISRTGKINITVKHIESFEFNGSNYLEYKMPANLDSGIMGSKEEIEITFKSHDIIASGIIWISDGQKSKGILSLKNHKLYFTRIYLLSSPNGTKRISEELEIHQDIKPNIIYNLNIHQKSGKLVMKIVSINESSTQSMIGRETLLPINSNVYFGGYKGKANLDSNIFNSSFVGVIYKARIKSVFSTEPVDIVQEMVAARSNPNIINHGNVKVVMKTAEIGLPSEASFLGTLLDRKMSLTISNPLVSVILPKWDFELLVSFEIEFSTFESEGLILFIGNSSSFIAVEIFDSKLYFVYKFPKTWKRVGLGNGDSVVNNNNLQNVYFGRDLSGNLKVFINKKEMLNNVPIPREFVNSSSVIGYYGNIKLMPREILSKSGFVGCIHFVGVNDVGYLNFSRWSPIFNPSYDYFGLSHQLNGMFLIGNCLLSSTMSCEASPCLGGWCQTTSISATGQLFNNYKCNCLYSSKSLSNNFYGSSEIDYFNIWIRNYLLDSRSKPCSEETAQILIIKKGSLSINFKIPFPFESVVDVEFILLLHQEDGCILKISDDRYDLEIMVVKGSIRLKVPDQLISLDELVINDNQWHGIHLKVRFGFVQIKVDSVIKVFHYSKFVFSIASSIIIGQCSSIKESHFAIKNLLYNQLNILQTFYESPLDKNLFYDIHYVYPDSQTIGPIKGRQSHNFPITFLNNFNNAKLQQPMKLSWSNEIEFQMKTFSSGSFLHLTNKKKKLSIVYSDKETLTFIYKNEYFNSEKFSFLVGNHTTRARLMFDLIKGVLQYTNIVTNRTYLISKDLFSWNIDDEMQIEFGRNINYSKDVSSNFLQDNLLGEVMNESVIGCLQTFSVRNDKSTLNINEMWTQIMQVNPSSSIIFGKCKSVTKCLSDYCINGICKTHNFTEVFCDCSLTEFQGTRCHIPKLKCDLKRCKNNGKCLEISGDINCQCNGTGFSGPSCEVPLCRNESCLNNGICYTIGNLPRCNCTTTAFMGNHCEISKCNSERCSDQGSCSVHPRYKTVTCHCKLGYFGNKCEENSFKNCFVKCQNKGVCSRYSPFVKLCSDNYCQSSETYSCDCDHTNFRGPYCDQAEVGFNPVDDGVIIMNQISIQKYNYLRILFQQFDSKKGASLMHIAYKKDHFLDLFVNQKQLWLHYASPFSKRKRTFLIGKTEKTNVLLLAEDNLEINYYFNSKWKKILLYHPVGSKIRLRRYNYNPKIILGANFEFKNTFEGLIAGFRWNGRDLLNLDNKVLKRGQSLFNISMPMRIFPHQSPHLVIPAFQNVAIIILLFVLFISLCLQILFFAIRSRRWTIPDPIIYVKEKQCLMNKGIDFEEMDGDINLKLDNIQAEWITTTFISPVNQMKEFHSVILTRDIPLVANLVVFDMLVIPRTDEVALVIYGDSPIQTAEMLYPVNTKDQEYTCVSIHASADYRYAYCHMRHNYFNEHNLVELQVWEVKDTWNLICRPPNVKFDFSVSVPGSSSHCLLVNCYLSSIFMWNLESSSIIQKITLDSIRTLDFNSITVSQNSELILINDANLFQVISPETDSSPLEIKLYNFPVPDECQQVLSVQQSNFLILTESQDVYLFDARNQSLTRRASEWKIVLVSKVDLKNKTQLALGTNTGEIYFTNDISRNQHSILGPKNKSPIICVQFSSDGSFLCAGYENNMIHVWRIRPGISICHFHAIHESGILNGLHFNGDATFIIASFVIFGPSQNSQNKIVLKLIDRQKNQRLA